jgi:hypothetical protein
MTNNNCFSTVLPMNVVRTSCRRQASATSLVGTAHVKVLSWRCPATKVCRLQSTATSTRWGCADALVAAARQKGSLCSTSRAMRQSILPMTPQVSPLLLPFLTPQVSPLLLPFLAPQVSPILLPFLARRGMPWVLFLYSFGWESQRLLWL